MTRRRGNRVQIILLKKLRARVFCDSSSELSSILSIIKISSSRKGRHTGITSRAYTVYASKCWPTSTFTRNVISALTFPTAANAKSIFTAFIQFFHNEPLDGIAVCGPHRYVQPPMKSRISSLSAYAEDDPLSRRFCVVRTHHITAPRRPHSSL